MTQQATYPKRAVALILAGGEGARLLGGEHPKALMRLVFTPVIEVLTDKLLAADPSIRILVVIREQWRHDFERWLEHYNHRLSERGGQRLRAPRSPGAIELLVEEDTTNLAFPECVGTVPAIYRTLEHLRRSDPRVENGEAFFIFNGDNYFDDDLMGFLKLSRTWLRERSCFCVNAAYHLPDYREAKRFGVIRFTGDVINDLIEKPEYPTPWDSVISTGCYALRHDESCRTSLFQFIERQCGQHGRAADHRPGRTRAAIDIAYVIKDQISAGMVVKFHHLQGAWFDIGMPRNFTRALEHYVARNIDPIRTVGDVDGRTHLSVADRCFLFAKPRKLSVTDTTLTIEWASTDPIAHTKTTSAAGTAWLDALAALLACPKSERRHATSALRRSPHEARLFLSGGVLLIDTVDPVRGLLPKAKARIPLQRRDFGARVDPDRLTMPAGSLDTLSLTECCYAEMQEEIVCYGDLHSHRMLFYLSNPSCPLSPQLFLEHVLRAQLQLPGIEASALKRAQTDRDAMEAWVHRVVVSEYDLSSQRGQPHVWEIVLKLDGRETDRGWFFVSLDRHTSTLECRKIAVADLSGVEDTDKGERPHSLYGRLAGIADGEGFGRMPVLFGADSLVGYVQRLEAMEHRELVDHICSGPDELLKIQCSGESGTGRFNRFNFSTPIVTTTPSVGALLRFLPSVFI